MNTTGKLLDVSRRCMRLAAVTAVGMALCLVTAEPAWAKTKKKKEEEVETKSYVLPYMIVISLMSVGIMTVCRPGRRLDRADEKKAKEEKEE